MEQKNQYTPGPWTINKWERNSEQKGVLYKGDANGMSVYESSDKSHINIVADTEHLPTSHTFGSFEGCHVASIDIAYGKEGEVEAGANARLIAAAPELLEALEKTTEMFGLLFGRTPYGDSPFAIGVPEGVMGKNAELIAKATGKPEQAEA